MKRFDFLTKYIFTTDDKRAQNSKHAFYKLDQKDILEAEKRLDKKFPQELRMFYEEIGYGFLCGNDFDMIDRLMDPSSVADLALGEGAYEGDLDAEDYAQGDMVAFFEVSEGSFITLDTTKMSSEGICPVNYFDTKIANSLLEFLERMDQEIDYYLEIPE